MTEDPTLAAFTEIALRRRLPRAGFSGPQEAVIVSVSGSGASTSCYFTVPKVSTTFKLGPAPCPSGATPGQRALVLFVGNGSGDPWIVAITNIPKPAGF